MLLEVTGSHRWCMLHLSILLYGCATTVPYDIRSMNRTPHNLCTGGARRHAGPGRFRSAFEVPERGLEIVELGNALVRGKYSI